MKTESRSVEELANREYKYGFVTDIEADAVPPGLSEDVIRVISSKKGEPDFLLQWRLKAYRHWLGMKEPDWAHVRIAPIDYQSISYYSAPRKKDGPRSLEEVDPKLLATVSGRISPSSLLSFQPALSFDGAVEGGTISGTVSLMGKTRIDVKAEGLTLSALPLPESLGVTGTGLFTGVFHSGGSAGEFRFTLLNAKIRGTSPVLSFIPLDRFNEVRGAGMISGGSMDIRSLSLAGKGVNARLKGKVAGTRVDLTMELMTDSSFTPDPLFQSLIERYRVSPGYYLVPVKAS